MNNQSAEELLQQMHMAIQEGNFEAAQQLKERYNALGLLQQIKNAMKSGDLDTVQQLKQEYDNLVSPNLAESPNKTR